MNEVVHVITPGDHFSPSTGSAVVTVVDGLASGRPPGEPRPRVAVARGTYDDRYGSADIIEYAEAPWHDRQRFIDAGLAKIGMPRLGARRRYAASVRAQGEWPPSAIVGHNAVQLMPVVDTDRHRAVLHAHNDLFGSYSRREADRTLGGVSSIIAVSDFLAERISNALPASLRERLAVVRNGVDLETFRPGSRFEGGPVRVVFVGRVIPDKGADVLVDAVVRAGRADVELLVVGSSGFARDTPLTAFETGVRAAAAPLGARVRFERFVPRPEVARILSTADIAVVPSRWPDPCPLTVLEGMASGAALIASDIGGIPESVRGGGILVPPADADALASVIDGLASDRAELRRVQASCLAFARSRDWSVASREFYQVLDAAR